MSNVLFLGGIFNTLDPVLGLTLYMWSWIIFLILIGVLWAAMYFLKWKPLKPLHGLYYALKNRSAVAFIFNAVLVGELVSERDAKCIFNYAEDEYEIDIPDHKTLDMIPGFKRLQTWYLVKLYYYPTHYLKDISPTKAIVYRIGGVNQDVEIARLLEGGNWERSATVVCASVPVDIIVDMDDWTLKRSRQHKAIVRSATEWNLLNPTDQIHSYQKYEKYLLNGNIQCPPELKITAVVPWQRIDAAFPLDLDENEWAGKKRQMAADREAEEGGELNRLALYVFLGGLGLAGLILLSRVVIRLMG